MRFNDNVIMTLQVGALLLGLLVSVGVGGNASRIFARDDSERHVVQNRNTLDNNDEFYHFNFPRDLTLDSAGRIYVADTANHRIVRMDDMTGKNWIAFGTLGSGVNQFRSPQGIAVDRHGRIYVSDGNRRIVRMDDMTGSNWVTLGTAGSGVKQFYSLQGIAVDSSGRIYVADTDNNRIVRMDDMTGKNWTSLGARTVPGAGPGRFFQPDGLTLDPSGRIYVVDHIAHRIVRMDDMSGTHWTTFNINDIDTLKLFSSLSRITVDAEGRIYVSVIGNSRIVRIDDMTGKNSTMFGTNGSGPNQFYSPAGLVVDSDGSIYIADAVNGRIVRMDDMTGTNWTTFGTTGGMPPVPPLLR